MTLEERFWSKVDRSTNPDACWGWTGSVDQAGYGRFWLAEENKLAHRIAYELATGQRLGELFIDHVCFNRRCVNPNHLRPVTRKENFEHRPGAYRNSKTGIRGVSSNGNGWRARVKHNGKQFQSKTFTTIEEAAAAALAMRLELFTHNDLDRRCG